MARILNRPMFRRGGSTGGITANLNKPRMGFEPGGQVPSYQEILASGGGVLDTVKWVGQETKQKLKKKLHQRIRFHQDNGVTT